MGQNQSPKLVRVITDTMVYEAGSPMPVPPGFRVEPFLISRMDMVEEREEVIIDDDPGEAPSADAAAEQQTTVTTRGVVQILARPDPYVVKEFVPPQCPEGMDPAQHALALEYKQKAADYERDGLRLVATIPKDLVVRTERLVGKDDYERFRQDLDRADETETPQTQDGQTERPEAPEPASGEPQPSTNVQPPEVSVETKT